MTTTPRPGDRSVDGKVQHLLWRLRARLVTPPREEQARSDLDRLFAAAHERAHLAPSAGASATPVGGPPGTPQFPLTADGRPVDELARRRRVPAIVHGIGRVAAAGVAVVLVGVGMSSAADGPVSFTALLGRQAAPPALDAPVDEPPEGTLVPDVPSEDELAAAPEVDAEADATGETGTAADGDATDDTTADAGTEPPPEPDPVPSAPPTDEEPPAPDTGADAGGDGAVDDPSGADGSDAPDAGDAPDASGGGDGAGDDPAPDDGTDDGQVIAAPPSAGLDGFGGTRCEDDAVEDCLDADVDSDDGSTSDEPTAGDSAEDLASRRYQPPAED